MAQRFSIGWLAGLACLAASPALADAAQELAREQATAANVTIVRDDWGIAHVHGHSDADAVFGMIYAEAEDDFGRIETNYLTALGRLSEAEGEKSLMRDLRARLYVDPDDLKARYAASPPWLQKLMDAWADGLNYYLATHPRVRPQVLTHFEPWMALSFSEGSIGGDIEHVSLADLAHFYHEPDGEIAEAPRPPALAEDSGSNGIAVAPANTQSHHALLLINPHTSYYFRSELQVASDEGLNAYGAATWGQFFLYQGFNERLGWMHTTSQADTVDRFVETIVHQGEDVFYRYGGALRPLQKSQVTLSFRQPDGSMGRRTFVIYKTHVGPIVARAPDLRWIAEAMMYDPVKALEQSFLQTKARTWAEYGQAMALEANTSNNTVYADADGTIAYLNPQFIPRRNPGLDYSQVVDGSDPAADWHGLHALAESPHILNPATGYIFNTNDAPWTNAGAASPRAADFPRYMARGGENMRGVHAASLLAGRQDFTLEALRAAAFDPRLPGFDLLIPRLMAAYDADDLGDPLKTALAGQAALLRGWDRRWGADSAATTLAVYWGEALWRALGKKPSGGAVADYDEVVANASPDQMLQALAAASDQLSADFGDWKVPWGQVNRFQRLNDDLVQSPSDAAPSTAVPFTSAHWGSLAAIDGERYPGIKKRYGDRGNSFVAVVEFGPRVRALAITAGGESGDPASRHFTDEAARFAAGDLREVYFYPDQLTGHTERTYHPGG
jgi:acyl-homoserine-lactone acylase